MKKSFLIVFAILASIPLALYFAWQFYTIYDSVYSGSAYGFTIGASKMESYSAINPHEFHSIWLIYPDRSIPGVEILNSNQLSFEKMEKVDQWELSYGSESLLDSIRLVFKDDKLSNIYRHRQASELP